MLFDVGTFERIGILLAVLFTHATMSGSARDRKDSDSATGVRVKTDVRDVHSLAKAVYWGSYSEVTTLSEDDEAYRNYIRMRNDRHEELKRAK